MIAIAFSMLAGCDQPPCEPCRQANNCPNFVGFYYGPAKSISDNCEDSDLREGTTSVEVISQTEQEEDATQISIKIQDSTGKWLVLEGTLCGSQDQEESQSYSFHVAVTDDQVSDDKNYDYHTLIGSFNVFDNVVSINANHEIRSYFDDGSTCSLIGNIQTSNPTE
jgi:hypothetical protein